MKKLFVISENEKNRILNLHENASNKISLKEQSTTGITQNKQVVSITFDGTNIVASSGDKTFPVDGNKTLNDIKGMFQFNFQKLTPEKPELSNQNVGDTTLPNMNINNPVA